MAEYAPKGRGLERVLGTGALFSTAYGNVLVKARGAHLDPSVLAASQMCFGLVPLVAAGAWLEGSPLEFHWTPLAVVCLLYLAVVGSGDVESEEQKNHEGH